MKRVIIESPYAGDVERNRTYLQAAIIDSLNRFEAPFASHGFYTHFLDDTNKDERAIGMKAGFAWGEVADLIAVYTDLGISPGMEIGITRAKVLGIPIEMRTLGW